MTPAPASRLDDPAWTWRAALGLGVALAALRVTALFATSLELYPDEAQYWLWSRALHWGYVSKPPMIAWLIRLTTALGGDGEAWVRLSAPVLHLAAMLALYGAGRRLYGPRAGLLAATLYGLMPAVQISALFIATDAPLMAFLAPALLAYVALWRADAPAGRRRAAAAFGLLLGLAFLAKYAAVFLVIGVGVHALVDRDARRAWTGGAWIAALAGFAVVAGPNLAWQAGHRFATVTHTAEVNAHWTASRLINPGKLAEFVLGQFGVMGPIPFAVLIGGAIVLGARRALQPADRLLLCLALPPLVLVSLQALISRAHAHWAATGYLAGVVLVAGWLTRWRAGAWTWLAIGLQAAVAAVVLAVVAAPSLVDASGNGRRLARLRGWRDTAAITSAAARAVMARGGLSATAVEDRYLFNELAYYGRADFGRRGSIRLRMRPPAHAALSEAELASPLRRGEAGRVLIAETPGKPGQPLLPTDFAAVRPIGRWTVVAGKRPRDLVLALASGYRR